MAERIKVSAGTSAITAGSQVPFTLHAKLFEGGRTPVVSVAGLAGVETISFWIRTGGTWEPLDDGAGTQVSFDTDYNADIFNAPGEYGITKTATAGAITLRVHDQR